MVNRILEDPVDPAKCKFLGIPYLLLYIKPYFSHGRIHVCMHTYTSRHFVKTYTYILVSTCAAADDRNGDRNLQSIAMGKRKLEDPVDPAKCKPIEHIPMHTCIGKWIGD